MMHNKNMTRRSKDSMLGMSLVEVLAAMLIGLIGMTIIMQVFSVSEERRRTTGGGSDAQINGNLATFTLERDLRNAGYGMFSSNASDMVGCTTVAYNNTRPTPDFTFTMAPVVITDGVAGAPDEIAVAYGNGAQIAEGIDFAAGANSDADFPLGDAAGFRVGAFAVASDPAAGINCALVEITGFAASSVQHINGAIYTFKDKYNQDVTITAAHNKPGGVNVGGAFTADAKLFLLGRSPVVKTYVIQNDRLQTKSLLPYNAAQDLDNDGFTDAEVGDGVVQLQAQYGKGNPIVWDNVTPLTNADWLTVRAVRVALLIRSQQFENAVVTAAVPTWAGGNFAMTNPDAATSWQNYRYRVFEKVVPLRNMIWGTDP